MEWHRHRRDTQPVWAVLAALLTDLRIQISRQSCSATALSELDWIVSKDTVVRPDVIVMCGPAPEQHLQSPPALVAEILSDSTWQNDVTYKRSLYEKQGVGTYLIIDPRTKTVDHLSLTPQGTYESIDASDCISLRLCEDCEIELSVRELFA